MKKPPQNLLDISPCRMGYPWREEQGVVTISRPNRGLCNRLAQLLYAAPRQSQIRLDPMGSFIWCCLDGRTSVEAVARAVREKFSQEAEPLYPRLERFLAILRVHHFITYPTR